MAQLRHGNAQLLDIPDKVSVHQHPSNIMLYQAPIYPKSNRVLRVKIANAQYPNDVLKCCLKLMKKKKKKIANRKIMYIVIRIFILHMQDLIGQKIQRIAWFQETQRFL